MTTESKFDFHLLLPGGDEPVRIESGEWKGIPHVGVRQLFRGGDGKLYFGKQGFNFPVSTFTLAVTALLEAFNKATGSSLKLVSSNPKDATLLNELRADMQKLRDSSVPHEEVHVWRRG